MVPSKLLLSPTASNVDLLTQSPKIWEYFLAYSTIISRQGSATCYQIVLVKNINSTHRVEGIPAQFGLSGALATSKADIQRWVKNEHSNFPAVATH